MLLDQLQSRLATYYARHSPEPHSVLLGPLIALSGGWASGVYTFTIHQDEMSGADHTLLVLKTYAPTARGREHALREWQALTRLRTIDYPVPRGKFFEPDDRHLGRPFIVMEHVPSRLLWHALEQADQSGQDRLTRLFVARLVALHGLAPQVLVPVITTGDPYAFVEDELVQLQRASQSSPHATLGEVVLWLERRKHDVPCERPVILHRDYHPWNVLVDSTEHLWVIDWDWQIGDYRFDLAWTLTLMRRSGFHAFCSAVEQNYARQSGRSLDQLTYFEVLTSIRWLFNVTASLESGEALRDAARSTFREFLVEPVRQAEAFLQACTSIEVQVKI